MEYLTFDQFTPEHVLMISSQSQVFRVLTTFQSRHGTICKFIFLLGILTQLRFGRLTCCGVLGWDATRRVTLQASRASSTGSAASVASA